MPGKPDLNSPVTRGALRQRLWQTLFVTAGASGADDSSIRMLRPTRHDADFAINVNQLLQISEQEPRHPKAARRPCDFSTSLLPRSAQDDVENDDASAELTASLKDALTRNLPGYTITIKNRYLNFSMTDSLLQSQIDEALEQGAAFGAQQQWRGRRVSVEFVSADPIGPLSTHRGRIALGGDALCRLLKWQGASVTQEYLINDDESSSRLNLLGESILAAYAAHFGESTPPPEGALDTPFVRQVAEQIAERDGNSHLLAPEAETAKIFAQAACRQAIESHKNSLQKLGVHFDVWMDETTLIDDGRLQSTMEAFRKTDEIVERDGILWLTTSRWGDDADRPLTRANGAPTYLASDIAYHLFRFERGFDTLINIWSSEHQQYVQRTQAALAAAGFDTNRLKVLLCAPVLWNSDGAALPESDSLATINEALAVYDVSTLRLAFLLQDWNKPVVVDRELLARDDQRNLVYQLLLLPARLSQLQRQAAIQDAAAASEWSAAETNLARWVAQWCDEVEIATDRLAPQRIATYLQQGTKLVGQLLAQNKPSQSLDSRLLQAASQVTRNAFDILGVEPAEKL